MIMEFKQASSVDEAVGLKKDGYIFLAGGTQVNSTPFKMRHESHRREKVVSLAGLGLEGISSEGGDVIVGATTTLQDIADSSEVPQALKDAAGFIPTRSVRNIATIGGNVGAKRPDSYVIPALIALGALAETVNGSVSVEEYVSTDAEDLILGFRIPAVDSGKKSVCRAVKESRSHVALPVVSAAVSAASEGGKVSEIIIAAGCVAAKTIRLSAVEEGILSGAVSLEGEFLETAIAGALHPAEDILGSRAFKTYLNSVLIADLVRGCIREVV